MSLVARVLPVLFFVTMLVVGSPSRADLFVTAGKNVQEYNTTSGAFVTTFASLIGSSAEGLAFGPNGDLLVTSIEDNAVEEFDGITGVFVKTVNTAPIVLPLGLAFGPDGNLFVGNANGFVDELDQSVPSSKHSCLKPGLSELLL